MLSVSATIYDGPTYPGPGIAIDPLLSQHSNERGKEGSSQTREKDSLYTDDGGIRPNPLRQAGASGGWSIPERSIGDDRKEGVAHLRVIWLELSLDSDDEDRRDHREETSLVFAWLGRAPGSAKDSGKPTKISTVVVSSVYFLMSPLSYSSAPRLNIS